MTSKQRMLLSMQNKKPDKVPVSPIISVMIPIKFKGGPFWQFFLDRNLKPYAYYGYHSPLVRKAYLELVKHFGMDGCDFGYIDLRDSQEGKRQFKTKVIEKKSDRITTRDYFRTPEGTLWREIIYFDDNPPWPARKYVKDIEKDLLIYLKYLLPDPNSCDDTIFQQWKKEMGDSGVTGIWVPIPGFPHLEQIVDGGIEAVIYHYYDHPKIFEKYREIFDDWLERYTKRVIAARPDCIQTGGSGTITLGSPQIFRQLGLPTLKKITRLAKEAGIPTNLHSCGKERELVKICAEETDLSCINPLEVPSAGDCDLCELKQKYGNKIALMGNINTTHMLQASPDEIKKTAKRCIDDAAEGGGFILSTGDQCGRDTPHENLLRMVEVARTYGRYS